GRLLTDTRVSFDLPGSPLTGAMLVTDPNGVFIELCQAAGPMRFAWNGLCVADLARSIAFYGTLGFTPAEQFSYPEPLTWLDKLNRLEGLRLNICVVRNAKGAALELIQVLNPRLARHEAGQLLDQIGLSNLIFEVAELDALGAQLVARGGSMERRTRVVI